MLSHHRLFLPSGTHGSTICNTCRTAWLKVRGAWVTARFLLAGPVLAVALQISFGLQWETRSPQRLTLFGAGYAAQSLCPFRGCRHLELGGRYHIADGDVREYLRVEETDASGGDWLCAQHHAVLCERKSEAEAPAAAEAGLEDGGYEAVDPPAARANDFEAMGDALGRGLALVADELRSLGDEILPVEAVEAASDRVAPGFCHALVVAFGWPHDLEAPLRRRRAALIQVCVFGPLFASLDFSRGAGLGVLPATTVLHFPARSGGSIYVARSPEVVSFARAHCRLFGRPVDHAAETGEGAARFCCGVAGFLANKNGRCVESCLRRCYTF